MTQPVAAAVGACAGPFGPRAWHAAALRDAEGHLSLPDAVLAELDEAVDYLRRNPLATFALRPADFGLVATHDFAASVHAELMAGCGFALIDRFPTEAWSRDEQVAAYWLLASAVARPVAQSHDGKLIYDVLDRGLPPGNGVRPDVTNVGQNFHTDNSYNHAPPHVVGLLCLQTAATGGVSAIVNFGWAYAQMQRQAPELLERLHRPFYFDRQKEHAPGETPVTHHPLFERRRGRLVARLSLRQVENGQRLAGAALDHQGRAALDALEAILERPGAAKTFAFEPGQIQLVNNLALGHKRSAFVDHPAPARRRHLVRLWLRDTGRPGYGG